MNASPIQLQNVLAALRQNFWLWAAPAVVISLAGFALAALHRPTWEASQALLVRDEAGGSSGQGGRFASNEAMQTALDTLLEISRNPNTAAAALKKVGPPADGKLAQPDQKWPAPADVEALQDSLAVKAPKGAEFGKTEVIYLVVKDRDPRRAAALAQAMADEMESRLQDLRRTKAQSIVRELEKTRELANDDLQSATVELQGMEREVGADLGELRLLAETGAGDSNLRTGLNQLKAELRQIQTTLLDRQQLYKHLVAAAQNTEQIVAMPNRLLESQPALRRLKDGLVDAQLRTAELLGIMSAEHPRVLSAQAAESAVRDDLRGELQTALRGVEADLRVSLEQAASLESQIAEQQQRLDKLAALRASYSNLVAAVRQRTAIVEKAHQDLSEARASGAAAETASLITRIDAPQVGDKPAGPGRATIAAAGVVGGLAVGFGLLFLFAPAPGTDRRRWNDCVDMGRRATDFIRGRRAGDRENGTAKPNPIAGGRRAFDPPAQ